jgi:hypothetical protein
LANFRGVDTQQPEAHWPFLKQHCQRVAIGNPDHTGLKLYWPGVDLHGTKGIKE